ncbi:MAG: beta-N-acetylhexosaminidase, partial [Pseudonocardiales bacterium]|nr:beta-N-acetylhexosaminidase [Pseudonocardiales bacterium]
SAVPGAAALGWLDDPAGTEEVYASIGRRLAAAGVTLNLAPVADVNVDPRNPVIGVRSFSADPAVAARQVAAAVRGIQRAGVAACAKHFPGHGATSADSHHEVATIERGLAELEAVELAPFRAAIGAGTRAVMTGHLLVPSLDERELATVSHRISTRLLREQLGFDGAVVTDALEMQAISATIGMVEGFVRALQAGADAIETGALDYPELIEEIPDAVLAAVRSGRLRLDRLSDAARRTALLASSGDPAAALDPTVVSQIAARCVEVSGVLPRLQRPFVVECRSRNGMATGELPWSVADRIAEAVPDTLVRLVDGPSSPVELAALAEVASPAELAGAAAGRSLVVVIRDPARNPWQRAVIELALRQPGAVLVDVGWPTERSTAGLPVVRTRGVAPGLLAAAVDVLMSVR